MTAQDREKELSDIEADIARNQRAIDTCKKKIIALQVKRMNLTSDLQAEFAHKGADTSTKK